MISFTGSNAVGNAIAVEGARLGKRVSLEMGGKNAIIVMDDADLSLAADAIAWSAFGTTGQRCTACSRVIVHERCTTSWSSAWSSARRRCRSATASIESIRDGPAGQPEPARDGARLREIGAAKGAQVEAGGAVATEGALAKGIFYQPTVFVGRRRPRCASRRRRSSARCVSFVKVTSLEEAIEVNNRIALRALVLDLHRAT